jgi:hypothetical protein
MATGTANSEENENRRPAESPRPRPAAAEAAPGNVDKIRDILFGSQMRDYEVRFARLEESLLKESADLKETTRKRFDTLESYIRKELESLEGRLKAEKEERSDGARHLAAEVKSLGDSLSKKIGEALDHSVQSERQLRKDLLQQSHELSEEIRTKVEQLAATLDNRVRELRSDKTDRSALAAMFTEVALRLNNEFQIPGSE